MFRKLAPVLVAPLLLMAGCATEAPPGAAEVRTGAADAATPAVEVPTGAAALAALRSAPDRAAREGTVSFEMTISGTAQGQSYHVTATGVVDADAGQMSMEMDLGAMLSKLSASSGQSLPPGSDKPMRIVVDGDSIYLQIPMLESLIGTSGWLSASPSDMGQSTQSLGLGAGGFDPAKLLSVLRGVSSDVTMVGREDVRGVTTTKYTATVSLAKALAAAPAHQRDALQSQLDKLGTGDVLMPVEVWVDADGLPRRYSMSVDSAGGAGTKTALRMEFFDYGQPVTIDVPSADQVTPIAEVLGGVLGGALGGAGS